MKIKRITLYNIGPYVGENTFDLAMSRKKNVILIGGKNGAGKTTFFKAIKTCLYGCKVWGYDAPGKEYYSVIGGLVNFKSLYDSSSKAYVEIELFFDDGKQINTYVLHREWKKIRMSFTEYFNIKKNGEIIMGGEEDDFVNYLLSIIPPDMFNFYFFDGESIADFFLGADGNKNFRNAFLKLYGLDTLSIMIENFNRNLKKSDEKKNYHESYLQAKTTYERQLNILQLLQDEIKSLENEIDLCYIKIKALQEGYSKEGGVSYVEWKEINSQILKEESERDSYNKFLKDVANHQIPFIIMEKNLRKLEKELLIAQDNKKSKVISQALLEEEFKCAAEEFLLEQENANIDIDALLAFIVNYIKPEEETISFDFTENQIHRISSQIYEKINFDREQVKAAISKINASLRKTKKLREKLTSSSIDGFEEFVSEKERIDSKANELKIELEKKNAEIELQKIRVIEEERIFEKAKLSYENILKSKSINNLSERAVAAYTLLEEKLVTRQGHILQEEFIRCFKSIINKNNFIDGIVIDKNINIIPYKYVDVTRQQLDNYKSLNREFLSLFKDPKHIVEMNKLEFDDVECVQLPSPIKAPFSQGERQVYIMSIYLALLKTSHKEIPFFIDTPFARIDSNHRANIVKEFFNKINNQLFILSTDEEIVGEYKSMMDQKIANKFILQINSYGKTRILSDIYFGDNK